MSDKILFYRTSEIPYGVFSNFDTRHPIKMPTSGIWPSTEHAFQAYKFIPIDPEYAEKIRLAPKPRDAAAMGRDRSHPLRLDWEQVKDVVMKAVVYAKFTQHEDCKKLLLSTGDAELIEHTENDSYWADGGDGTGRNMLGKILMQVREQLREAEEPEKPQPRIFMISQYSDIGEYKAERFALDDLHTCFTEIMMYNKLMDKYRQGYSGWDNPDCERGLLDILRNNIVDEDWVDVANIAMFLWNLQNMKKIGDKKS